MPDRHAIVADHRGGIKIAVIRIKMYTRGIDLHQMAESTAGGNSTIKARSPRDLGHDQALLWSDQSGNQDHNHERSMATIIV